jgi:flagellar protein FliO/FliZ
LLLMLRMLALLLATTGVANATPVDPAAGPAVPELAGFVVSLFVVIAAILAFGWLYARFRPGHGGQSDAIRVVATRPLGPRERLVVVEVGGEQILVGVTQTQMQSLHTLSEPIRNAAEPAAAGEAGFAGRLKAFMAEAGR